MCPSPNIVFLIAEQGVTVFCLVLVPAQTTLELMLNACGHDPDEEMAKSLLAEFVGGMEEELSFEEFSAMLRSLDSKRIFDEVSARCPRARACSWRDDFSPMPMLLVTRLVYRLSFLDHKYDTDGSGSIDVDELYAMLAACGHALEEGAAAARLMRMVGGAAATALNRWQFGEVRRDDPDDGSSRLHHRLSRRDKHSGNSI